MLMAGKELNHVGWRSLDRNQEISESTLYEKIMKWLPKGLRSLRMLLLSLIHKLQSVLVSGADFYSCPRVSPDGYKIAWDLVESSKHESISNNNISLTCCFVCVSPFKSWDSTDIWLAELPQSGLEILPGTQQKEFGILDTKEQSYRKVETGLTTHDRFGSTSRGSIYSIAYSLPRSLEWMLIQKRC
ncbi:acylamino-acid-releasing enzyme [Biomphalaria glabrata]|nr:acylamino-acid-releasing enzyme [Biomphalaria glabrata]